MMNEPIEYHFKLGVIHDPELEKVAFDAQIRLERVIEAVKK
jgi:hypothetical protein